MAEEKSSAVPHIRAGQAKSLTLQQAKLHFPDEFEDSVIPFYWSGMVFTP